MFKELKYLFYLLVIFLFIFFISKYYFSDQNKKKSYRSLNSIDQNIEKHSTNLQILKSDTDDIIVYSDEVEEYKKKKKKYNFFDLIKKQSNE